MKHKLVLCLAVTFCIAHSLASAQSITLDSLWGKFVGGMRTMSFSPDSKHLLIADDTGGVKVLNALTGEEVNYFTPQFGCYRMKFSDDGSRLFLGGYTGMEIRDTKTYLRMDTMWFKTPMGNGAAFCDVSPDEKHIVIKSGYTTPDAQYTSYLVYSYPERQFIWQKDVVSYSVPLKIRYAEGKVVFTNDGNYILGLNTTSLCKWDWRDSTKPAEVLIDNLPNLELISFSPDRNYCVFKNRGVWSLITKSKLIIDGVEDPIEQERNTFTLDSKYLLWNDNWKLKFVDLERKKTIFTKDRITGIIAVSNDNQFVVCESYRYSGVLDRINFVSSSNTQIEVQNINIKISPLPSNDQTSIIVSIPNPLLQVTILISNEQGQEIQRVFSGELTSTINNFSINNKPLPSGTYFLQLQYGTQTITKQFIITK